MEAGIFLGLREYLWLCKLAGGTSAALPCNNDGLKHEEEAVLHVCVDVAPANCVEDRLADVAAPLD